MPPEAELPPDAEPLFDDAFEEAPLPVWVEPLEEVVVSVSFSFEELLPDSVVVSV